MVHGLDFRYPMTTQDHGRDPKCLRPQQKRPKLRARQHPGSLRHRLVLPKRPARLLSAAERTTAVLEQQRVPRSEEHTSELQSLMRISYAVFCWHKKTRILPNTTTE